MSDSNVRDYLALVTSEHNTKPKFMASLAAVVGGAVHLQNLSKQMIPNYDIDSAYGIFLDIIGIWVGLSRRVEVPVTGIYFAWDDVASDGWDFGIWQGPFDPTSGLTQMPDDIYYRILKGKIAANHWDGTVEDMYRILAIAYPSLMFLIQDNQNMTMWVGVGGPPLDTLTKTLLTKNYIGLKPEGVGLTYYFSTVDAPIFCWDMDADNGQGWDTGCWAETF